MSHRVQSDSALKSNGCSHIASPNGRFHLVAQNDGNIVLYDGREFEAKSAIWASNTDNKGSAPFKLAMQKDGHLVMYDKDNKSTWATGVYGKGAAGHFAQMQDDGNFVVYDGANKPMWCTRTDNGQRSPKFGEGEKLM